MATRSKRAGETEVIPDGPMDPSHRQRARRIIADFSIILEPQDDGTFVGRSIELPYCLGHGKTASDCFESTRRVLEATVATMLEAGHRPPTAAREKMRTEQVNIRLTQEEKLILEQAAQVKGFQNLSSFLRSVALAEAR